MPAQDDVLRLVRRLRPWRPTEGVTRLGVEGGWVVPNTLEGVSAALVFDETGRSAAVIAALAERGIRVVHYRAPADPSPVPDGSVDAFAKHWSTLDDVRGITLAHALTANGLADRRDLMLVFDVDGREWDCLPAVDPEHLVRFKVIAGRLTGLLDIDEHDEFARVRRGVKALVAGHIPTHVHADNSTPLALVRGVPLPATLEISLLRMGESTFTPYNGPLPAPEDRPSTPREEIIVDPWRHPDEGASGG
ncbi:MAG: hypothetical protein WCP95_01955 [Actinomycetes bacterium]